MCTVSFLPVQDGFILTSNRDESVSRCSLAPSLEDYKGELLIFPQDPLRKGTWIAISPFKKRAACLLNGAFSAHERAQNYKMSRGMLLLDSFIYPNINLFNTLVDLSGLEPFTLILIEWMNEGLSYELIWDGTNKYFRELDFRKPVIWSSATLYNTESRIKKEKLFHERFFQNSMANADEVIEFHQLQVFRNISENHYQVGNDFQTVSISQILITNHSEKFRHFDLVTKKDYSLDV